MRNQHAYYICIVLPVTKTDQNIRLYLSDNSLVGVNRRSNYRCYTCILYLNDDWDCDRDGGALRIYPDSLNVLKPRDASVTCEYMDVNPENGQLLIFDSRLVHSVKEVTSTEKCRLALTLWTLRPENSGVGGEVYDAGSDIEFVIEK